MTEEKNLDENMVCPKCSYKRKKSEEAPDWQCPSCGIAYKKYSATFIAKGEAKLDQSQSGRRDKKIILLLSLVAVVMVLTIAQRPGDRSEKGDEDRIAVGVKDAAFDVSKFREIAQVNTNEIITLGGVAVDESMKIAKIINDCLTTRNGERIEPHECREIKLENGKIRVVDENFEYGGVKTRASFNFSSSGEVEYIAIGLPWDKKVIDLLYALREKYGPNFMQLNDTYIDPEVGSYTRLPGGLSGWRDKEGKELILMMPSEPASYINKRRSEGASEIEIMLLKVTLTPKVYIHSAKLVSRVGGDITDPKSGEYEDVVKKRRLIKEKI